MIAQDKCVWVKSHKPTKTWYVLRDWMYGGQGIESTFDNIEDAIARAKEVASEHGAAFRVFGAPLEESADEDISS